MFLLQYFHSQTLGDDKCVTLTLKASNDGHLSFFEAAAETATWGDHGSEHYEIAFSGWGNTQS